MCADAGKPRSLAGAMAGDQVPEVIGAAGVAPVLDHEVEPTGAQTGELVQGFKNERQVGIDDRGAVDAIEAGQAGLGQYPGDAVAMRVQLGGDGADRPVIGVVPAQDFCFSFGGKGHTYSCSAGKSEPDSAGSPGAPPPVADDGSGSSARLMVSPAPSVRPRVDQPPLPVGNHDASHSSDGLNSGVAARHVDGGQANCLGNAGRPPARSACAPFANWRDCSSDCLGRSGCISPPPCGIQRTGSFFRELPSAYMTEGSGWQRPLRNILSMQRCLVATGVTLVLTWRLGSASRQHLPTAGQLSTSSVRRSR